MQEDYGTLYEVEITFRDSGVCEEKAEEIRESGLLVKEEKGNRVIVEWEVPENEGVHEIENALFYMLDGGNLGGFRYKKIR